MNQQGCDMFKSRNYKLSCQLKRFFIKSKLTIQKVLHLPLVIRQLFTRNIAGFIHSDSVNSQIKNASQTINSFLG